MVVNKCMIDNESFLIIMREVILENKKILGMTYQAFLNLKEGPLKKAEKKGKEVSIIQQELIERILMEHPQCNLIRVVSSLEAIKEYNFKLINSVERKNREKVLFTAKAVGEIKDIFTSLEEMMLHTYDLLTTNNSILANHLYQESKEINAKVMKYATMHEDRLSKGICLPIPSIIYLLILDSLSSIVNQLGNIGIHLLEYSGCEKLQEVQEA